MQTVLDRIIPISPKKQPDAGTVHWLNECVKRGERETFAELITLTPGLAKVLLDRNPHNRNVRQTKVAQYASDMRSGRWALNGEPIIVAKTGELNDGQNRCEAVIDANTPIQVMLMFGVERETRTTVDQGATRGAGDFLGMNGVENANSAATIARLLLAYEASGGQGVDTKPFTNAQVTDRAQRDANIEVAAHFAHRAVTQRAKAYVAGTLIGFCYLIFSRIDENDASDFLTAVCTGEGLKSGHPALVVREKLLSVGKSRPIKIALLFRAWNFYRRGAKVKANGIISTMPLPALI